MMILAVTLLPALLAIPAYALTKRVRSAGMILAVIATIISLLVYSYAMFVLAPATGWVCLERYAWLVLGGRIIEFKLFVDNISYILLLATGVLYLAATIYAYGYVKDEDKPLFYLLWLLLLSGLYGVFTSGNLIAFYLFWEFYMLPSFFIIAKWGYRDPAKVALKFFIFSHVGAVFMIAAIGFIAVVTGGLGLDIFWMAAHPEKIAAWWHILFLFFVIGFGIKMALVPVHTWLPEAHGEAPTPMSAILSGAIIEAGAYGIIRFACSMIAVPVAPIVGVNEVVKWLIGLAVVGLITTYYGSLCAIKEVDIKRIVAYSSIAHMGYMALAIGLGFAYMIQHGLAYVALSLALVGALFHLLAHAWNKGLWFLVAGGVMHALHERNILKMGGLLSKMIWTGVAGIVACFGIMGAPPLPCFYSEICIIMGAVTAHFWIGVLYALALVFSAGYALRFLYHVFWKEPSEEGKHLLEHAHELNKYMLAGLYILVIAMILVGILFFPQVFWLISLRPAI